MTESKSVKKHKLHKRNSFMWMSVRDAIEGSNAVKLANELYLPIPQGFIEDNTSASSTGVSSNVANDRRSEVLLMAPYYHRNPAYMSYLHRARFPEITIHTLRGLIGIATRNNPEIELPAKLKYLEGSAMQDGSSIKELFAYCLAEVLSQGGVSIVIDVIHDSVLKMSVYDSTSFINWETKASGELKEAYFEENQDDEDNGEKQIVIEYSMELNEEISKEPILKVTRYIDGDEIVINPSVQGVSFSEIPVVNIGSIKNEPSPNPVPLLGVSEIAYSIYRKDADLSQAQYMTCNPMFVITGAENESGVPVTFGSTAALILPRPEAKAFFPSTDTSALGHVKESISDLKEEAATFGASLVGPSKKAAEATETLKMRQGAQGATLVGVVENVSKGVEDALKIAARLVGADPDSVVFSVTTDFAERELSPTMLTALVSTWQNGAMSKESLLKVMKEAGLSPRNEDIEEELLRIESDGPADTE